MPCIDDLIDRLLEAKVSSSLDLQSGYHQTSISGKDTHKTAFTTHKGLFTPSSPPKDCLSATAAFQRQMNKMFEHPPLVVVYLENILVFLQNGGGLVFVLFLRENNFYAKLSKCSFFQHSTELLVYIVDCDGLCIHRKRFIEGYSHT